MTLDKWPLDTPGKIARVDWHALGISAARRLRAMGFEAGAEIETIRQGGVIAVRIGRMTVGVRATQAAAVDVE
jgi:ferrous iron transport protein A